MRAVARPDEVRGPAFAHSVGSGAEDNGESARGMTIEPSRTVRLQLLQPMLAHVLSAWRWLEQRRSAQLVARRLRVAETVSLGEKRFVSILEVDGAHYLIGGSSGSVQLLTTLNKRAAVVAMNQSEGEPS